MYYKRTYPVKYATLLFKNSVRMTYLIHRTDDTPNAVSGTL